MTTAYRRPMPEDEGGPALSPTLSEWLKAREETARHLASGTARTVDEAWVQRLADLLATERSWQDQYTGLVALGSTDGRFPHSNR
ncbi:hypothetical protein SAMN05660733_01627 [Lentzea albidocapillata]|uniref:Uncharacterized protein n=2 Tax=Lentzea albidocapillata TaxID=40571 RepID=A0A1W2BYT9_9PSEU|nr:hypothetical protein SAMN05660733_01627 [Lentzea albidocapillata]